MKLPNTIWMCEDEQARWFEFDEPFDLPDAVTVTKMVPEKPQEHDAIITVTKMENLTMCAIDWCRLCEGEHKLVKVTT